MTKRIPCAVVGATGLAGQQFLTALAAHPRFELVKVAASSRSAGKPYAEAIRGASGNTGWYAGGTVPAEFAKLVVEDGASIKPDGLGVVFSAVESDVAKELEPRMAAHIPVISTASAFRYEADVPILVPGVNLDHAAPLIAVQQKKRGWKGFVSPNPNCTTTGLVITLAPIHARFGVKRVIMTSLQAMSGAGRSPGVIGLDIIDNVIPFISGEEEKVQKETQKILGTITGAAGESVIAPAQIAVSCTCTRVAVMEGHTESVFVELAKPATAEQLRAAWASFGEELAGKRPSAPSRFIHVLDDPFRPQPRLDRETEDGMATSVGRLRPDPALENGWKWVLVSHNTKMGAAKGAVLVAEDLAERGLIK